MSDATSIAQYGTRRSTIEYYTHSLAQLTDLAEADLERLKDPVIERKISAIDLSKVDIETGDTPKEQVVFRGAKIRIIPPSTFPGGSSTALSRPNRSKPLGSRRF